jgi:hypothetical protein
MKFKSKQKTLTITYPTKLFLEDLEHIYAILKEVVDKVTIDNDDFEFENLHDLSEMKSSDLKNLNLIGYKNNWPTISFLVYPNNISIRINQDEPSLLGAMEKIKEVISTRRLLTGISRTPQLILSFLLIFVMLRL